MKLLKNYLVKPALFVALMASFNVANAQKEMVVGTWLWPEHTMNKNVFPAWDKAIQEATGGKVKIKLEYHKGHPKDVFALTEDGSYDAGWSFHGYISERFKLPVMVELALLRASPEAASHAYWKIYQKYFADANEHDGLTLAALFMHGPGQILMREPIKSLADMKGKKIRVGGGIQGKIAKEMDVVAVAVPGSKVYEILSQGVADGVFMPVGELYSSRLNEVVKFVYEIPGGMYLGSFGVFINPDFLASLDSKTRKALLSTTGVDLSTSIGAAWGKNDALGYEVAKEKGISIQKFSGADVLKFKRYATIIEEDWLESVKDKNIDAKKALAEFRRLARSYPK